jgi:uncharacterized protein YecT (DUF1311 family)
MPRPSSRSILCAAALLAALPLRAAAAPCAAADPLGRLICAEPALQALDRAVAKASENAADKKAQRDWLAGRMAACPAAGPAMPAGQTRAVAVDCLGRLYEERLAVLDNPRNAAAWPKTPFRPALVEGAGVAVCEGIERDLVAAFFGHALVLDPLGEREIGFAPVAGLGGDETVVLRADIDADNSGKPLPVLEFVDDKDHGVTIEYRAYASPEALLAAIGRGIEPLAESVRQAGKPVAAIAASPRPADEAPRFFRDGGQVYLLVPGAPGALAVFRLSSSSGLQRLCLYDAHLPVGRPAAKRLQHPEIAAMLKAAAPLLPTGTLCQASGEAAKTLDTRARWRPWALDRAGLEEGGLDSARLALYMRNRSLGGPEPAQRYRDYVMAQRAAIAALAPLYQDQFGRAPAEARHLAALYLDARVADGFQFDPDDAATARLLTADYADKHSLQRAAAAGDTAALRGALGLEPNALAAGVQGDLDEPLVADALDHRETLKALLEMGVDPDSTGASGRTALMMAARLDRVDAARILIAYGASVDAGAGDKVAETDIGGDPSCMRGDAAHADTPGRTALSYAAERASPALVRLLLAHGADPHKPDAKGRKPADYVKYRGGDKAAAAKVAELLK